MARERGIQVHEASDEFREEIRTYVRADLKDVAEVFASEYGVSDPQAMIDDFMPVLERWYGLVEGVETREDLRTLFWDEIYARIDADYALQ